MHFFCYLNSVNSISEPNNQVCVLGAINERYEALCDVRLYVFMCLELSAIYSETVRVFVFSHKTEWVCMVLRNLNLEEQ